MIQTILNQQFDYLLLFVCLLSYLIGSISFAILVCKIRGLDDPRVYGSNNPGATNVMRTGDAVAAVLTLVGDAFKGFLVIMLVKFFWVDNPSTQEDTLMLAVSMIAVFMGHLFPVFFKFKGGKGVATSGGILIGIDVFLGISVFCVWLFAYCLFSISSIAALSSAFAAVFFAIIFVPLTWPNHYEILIFTIWVISLILFIRHHANIQLIMKNKQKNFLA
jgi:glycerol-3-phosphate acyltransferase PlsY